MKEPIEIPLPTFRGILILTIVTVLAATYFVWWGRTLEPLPQPRLERHGEAILQGPAAVAEEIYLEPRRVLWVTPQGAVLVPVSFALALQPIVQCESRWNPDAVGDAGELGLAQIHVRVHRPRMESMGLDPQVERDRIIFAVALYRERGTSPWSYG